MNKNIKRIVNPLKNRFFKLLTLSIKNSKNIAELSKDDKQNIRSVLVTRPNHRLGNQLLISPLIQTIESEFPNCKIDLLVNGNLSKVLFKNYQNIGKIHSLPKKPFKNLPEYIKTSFNLITSKYDLAIAGEENSNSSKIFVKLARARFKIFNSGTRIKLSKHISKRPIDNLLNILNYGKEIKSYPYPKLDIKLTDKEIEIGKEILSSFYANKYKTVSIFTNATGDKKISKIWWNEFCSKLKECLPEINILEILPKENISQVDFKYKSYLSDDLREIASIIENCSVFVGADSGVMHLATSTNTTTFGLFNGVTDHEIYGPYGNNKYVIEIQNTDIDKLVKKIEHTIEHISKVKL